MLPAKGFAGKCVSCLSPGSNYKQAAQLDLMAMNSCQSMVSFTEKDQEKLAFERDVYIFGQSPAIQSNLFNLLRHPDGHQGIHLDEDAFQRLATWIDVYAQKLGSFSNEQERQLSRLRQNIRTLLAE